MYTYEPIHQGARGIRLLRPGLSLANEDQAANLELELRVVSLDQASGYCALSYVWGDESPTVEVVLGGNPVSIRRNLYEALIQVLQNGLKHEIWVDAICIDQVNLEEKSWQVNQMGDIFSQAIMVYAWLGPATDDSELAMQQLQIVGDQALTAGVVSLIADSQAASSRLSKYLESARPKDSIPEDMACDFVALSAIYLGRMCSSMRSKTSCSSFFPSFSMTYFDTRAITARRERRRSRQINLLDLLQTFTNTPGRPLYSASDPRDVVFGLLGICADVKSLGLHADYRKSVAEVYTEATRAFLAHSPEYRLDYCTFPKDLPGLPSWVPDWNRKGRLGVEFYPIAYDTLFNASSNRKPLPLLDVGLNPAGLRQLGFRIDTVVAVLGPPRWRLRDPHDWPPQLENMDEWLEAIASFGQVGSISDIDEDILWRTLVLNHYPQGTVVTTEWVGLACTIFRRRRLVPESFTKDQVAYIWRNYLERPNNSQPTAREVIERFTNSCLQYAEARMRHRTLFKMASGRVCLGPESIQEGDIVSILFGSQAPIVLRSVETGQYSYIGDAYVHDVLDGQFIETEPTEEIFCLV
ncbi:heterokaryon incompatibility protein-domain-containing protein [Xylariales sp. AK1849]|nr:heterokaryon incompatibility protein-domain-containing protein [Xylariales sp. AK1849]